MITAEDIARSILGDPDLRNQVLRAVRTELECLSAAEAAAALSISPRQFLALAREHQLPVVDLGHRSPRYHARDVLELVERRKSAVRRAQRRTRVRRQPAIATTPHR